MTQTGTMPACAPVLLIEDESAVIAAAVHPAGELDRPIDVVRAERSTGNAREFRMGHVRPP